MYPREKIKIFKSKNGDNQSIDDEFSNALTWILSLPEELYHKSNRLSHSGLKEFSRSPAHYKEFVDQQGKETKKPKKSFEFGSLVHRAVLEPDRFERLYACEKSHKMDGLHRGSKEYKTKLKDFKENHPETVLIDNQSYEDALRIRDSLYSKRITQVLLSGGHREITGFFDEPQTGLKCRLRADYVNFSLSSVIDLKTTTDARRESFERELYNYRYYSQAAFYLSGFESITGTAPEAFVFLTVEKSAPFAFKVYELDKATIEVGRNQCLMDLLSFKGCLEKDLWPGYETKEPELLALPYFAWAKQDDIERELNEKLSETKDWRNDNE